MRRAAEVVQWSSLAAAWTLALALLAGCGDVPVPTFPAAASGVGPVTVHR